MIALRHPRPGERQWIIRPNRSLTGFQVQACYAAIAAPVLAIGLGASALGLPLILPFSGIEALGLGIAFYVSWKRGERREIVGVDGDSVYVEREPDQYRARFPRYWARIHLEAPGIPWYPTRLILRSHGRAIEIGAFLGEEERQSLARDLRSTLGMTASTGAAPI